jgi:outer membrane protein
LISYSLNQYEEFPPPTNGENPGGLKDMKRWKYSLAAILVFSVQAVAHAQTLKIGLVDFQRALNEVNEGKNAKAALKTQFETKQNALTAKQESLKTLKDQLETQRAALSADAMKKKEAEYRDQFLELQKTLAQYRNEMATKEAEMTQNIVKKMRGTVAAIGAKDGYNLIFETSQDALLYAPNATDITTQVVTAFNAGNFGSAASSK